MRLRSRPFCSLIIVALSLGGMSLRCAPAASTSSTSTPAAASPLESSTPESATPESASVLLTDRFEAGSWYVEIRDTSQESDQDGGINENVGVVGVFETITAMPSGHWSVAYVFDRRVFQEWDSDDPTRKTGRLDEVFGPTLGQGVQLELDADGRVVALSGLNELIASVRAKAGEGRDVEFYLSEFTEAELQRNLFEVRHVLFPRREVTVGDSWQASRRTAPLRGSLHKVYSVTLDRLESANGRTLAHVRFEATATGPADDTATIIAVRSLSTTGTAVIDVEAGRIVAYAEDAVMKFDQVISDTGETIERESRMQRTITVVPAAERKR